MKKLLVVLMVCALLCSSALAAETDLSAMSVAELQEVINAARSEILRRTARNDGTLFVVDEADGLQIYITGKGETDWSEAYQLEAVVINGTQQAVTISFDNVVINGWETEPFGNQIPNIGAGKKKKGSIPLTLKDAELTSVSQIEEVEITFHTFDPASYYTIGNYGPYTFYYDGAAWYGGAGAAQPEIVAAPPETAASELEGFWKLTAAREKDANEEDTAYMQKMIDSGLITMTFAFVGNVVTGTMSSMGEEESERGTFVVEGNTLTITEEEYGTVGGPIEFRIDGDTLEMTFPYGTMVFTRQPDTSGIEDAGESAAHEARETVEALVEDALKTAEDKIEGAKETVEEAVTGAKEAAEDAVAGAKEAVGEAAEAVREAVEEAAAEPKEFVEGIAGEAAEAVQEKVADAADKINEIKDQVDDKIEEIRDKVDEKVDGIMDVINRLTNP